MRSQRVAAAGIKARRAGILTLWMPFLQDNGNSLPTHGRPKTARVCGTRLTIPAFCSVETAAADH